MTIDVAPDSFPTWRRLQTFRKALTPITRARTTAALLGLISLVGGLGVIIFDGFFATLPQFRKYWIAIGALAFYGPGVCFALAYWGLRAGRVWTLWIAIAAAVWQSLLAVAAEVVIVVVASLVSPLLIVGGVLGVAINTIFVLQLLRARPWVKADITGHHGFAVEAVEAETVSG